ncbi:type II secretion system protein GspN [Leptospira sp. 'Mane']|uniref:type II secretion system protein GspN n=1 Tax=Leptospira sp. 'Mane' TaxID=3387407 RepID=UPI00398B7FD9
MSVAKEKDVDLEPELENELSEDELIQESLLENGESDEVQEGEEDNKQLNSTKILMLVGLGIFSFVLFFFFTFPLDEIVRSVLADSSKETGIVLEAKEIHFPFFGRKSFDSFVAQFTSGSIVKAEELSFSLSLFGLLSNRVDGDAEIGFLKYEGGEWSVQAKSVSFPIKISAIDDKITRWNGEGEILLTGGKFFESMEIPLLGSLKGQEIKRASFQFKIRSGKVMIEKGLIDSSIAKIQFQGVVRLSDSFALSQLEIKVCANLNDKFAQERQDIAGLATLLPQENGKICIPIRGSISSPKVDIPNLNQLGGVNSNIQTEQPSSEPGSLAPTNP